MPGTRWPTIIPAVAAIAGLTIIGVNLATKGVDHALLALLMVTLGGLGGFYVPAMLTQITRLRGKGNG